MELLKPDFGLMFWTALVFLSVLFILSKFAWKPIMAALHERENSIDNALKAAEKARQEMTAMKSEHERLLNEAREERTKMLNEARVLKEGIINEAKEKAKTEGAKIMEATRREINTEKMAAIAELKNQVGVLAIEIAERILKKEMAQQNEQKEYINSLVKEIELN